jgi:hypothetical protein
VKKKIKTRNKAITPPQNDEEWFVYLQFFLANIYNELKKGSKIDPIIIEVVLLKMAVHDIKHPHVETYHGEERLVRTAPELLALVQHALTNKIDDAWRTEARVVITKAKAEARIS